MIDSVCWARRMVAQDRPASFASDCSRLTGGGPPDKVEVRKSVSDLAKALVATQAVGQNARNPNLADALLAQSSPQ